MMSNTKMYGVVLWADVKDRKAVIWCEDHGNLAFYTPGSMDALNGVSLDAGDLVQFELREEKKLRYARNPQLVVQAQCPNLVHRLNAGGPGAATKRRSGCQSNVHEIKDYQGAERRAASAWMLPGLPI